MSGARAEIFARLKAVLDQRHNPSVRFSGAHQRMCTPPPALIPQRGQTHGATRLSTFVDEAQRAGAQVVSVDVPADIPGAVVRILQDVGVSRLKIAPHPELLAMDWSAMDVARS